MNFTRLSHHPDVWRICAKWPVLQAAVSCSGSDTLRYKSAEAGQQADQSRGI